MGLASALSTALTGLTAAETTIDVVGNNLANSNTVGFKASSVNFATQFLQTQSLGASADEDSGGTNPRQLGLGTMVADVTPNFSQGTIEISSNQTDLAIQGEGFFIVQGNLDEEFYTRNGVLKMNSQNELVTITGNRLLGHAVDDQFQLVTETLQPLTIPLGSAEVAKATENVELQGTLTPTGDVADTAEIIQTAILGNAELSHPTTAPSVDVATPPSVATGTAAAQSGAGTLAVGHEYRYQITFADSAYGGNPDTEGLISADIDSPINLVGPDNQIYLNNIPNDADYSYFRVYRSTDGGDYCYIAEQEYAVSGTTDFTDNGYADGAAYAADSISGSYSYYVTFTDALGGPGVGNESRPSEQITASTVSNGRIHLTDLPTDATGDWLGRRIYRNVDGDENTFYFVAEIDGVGATSPSTFTDYVSDATIEATAETIDLDGPKVTSNTLLTDVMLRDDDVYEQVFTEGTLEFTGKKGGRVLAGKELEITSTTTVADLNNFMEEALGIVKVSSDPLNPIPADAGSGDSPGASVGEGRIRLVGNNGEDNAIDIGLSGMQLTDATGTTSSISMPFTSAQSAVGQSAVADFIAYDSMGMPLAVRLTAVMEARDANSMTYRWFADSADNSPVTGVGISVGTGLVSFDGEGNLLSTTESTVSVDRTDVPSVTPLQFELDFSELSGLAAESSSLAISYQDGSGPGKLTSFIVSEDGLIRGVFSNGITRDLGQIVLARFGNPTGLEQLGQNLFAPGVNSGLAVTGNPGQQGLGTVISGAVELSNTDIGSNLIDLILASTMYRGNTRVITTSQQMLEELLALRR